MVAEKIVVNKFGDIFHQMENILHCGLYTYNIPSKEMQWSHGVYEIFGIDKNTSSSEENFFRFVNAEHVDLVKEALAATLREKTPYQIEFSITTAKGLQKRLYAENHISFDALGEMTEHNGVVKDITESYYYKRALEQKIIQLDKSNRNLQEFVYVASHDLQEPLRKISTFTERLNSKFESVLAQEGTMFVKRILTSTKGMQTLLEDLLNFSRLSFDEKQFEKISIGKVLESVISDLEVKIEETKTVITYDEFPEIEVYPSQLKQLFINLISNAIKFRKNDSASIISIKCAQADASDFSKLPLVKDTDYLKIIIQDNGIGFEQEFSEKIFTIFQRLNGKAEYAGSGVGLAICKKIVDNHQGFIFANSEADKGSTFTVLLPQSQS